MLYTPAQLQSTPFELSMGSPMRTRWWSKPMLEPMVACWITASCPLRKMQRAILPQLKNMLIFTTFQPATAFGQPTSSHVILTFSKVQVRG